MVEASVSRTVGDIGEYILYDMGQFVGGIAAVLAGMFVADGELGGRSNEAAMVSIGVAVLFFALASYVVDDERLGDMASTATLGALGVALLWWYGLDNLRGDISDAMPRQPHRGSGRRRRRV